MERSPIEAHEDITGAISAGSKNARLLPWLNNAHIQKNTQMQQQRKAERQAKKKQKDWESIEIADIIDDQEKSQICLRRGLRSPMERRREIGPSALCKCITSYRGDEKPELDPTKMTGKMTAWAFLNSRFPPCLLVLKLRNVRTAELTSSQQFAGRG